jgi:hypothetical protein
VAAAVLAAAATPQQAAALVKAAAAATQADKEFVTTVVAELIDAGQLHKYPGKGKNLPYGREKPTPPHPLDVGPGRKAFAGLVTAARKVLVAAPGVPVGEVMRRLQELLADGGPSAAAGPTPVGTRQDHQPPPAVVPPHPARPPELTPERVRDGLKAAYEELCLDVEFQDRLVEVPRLYHEAVKALPGLTVEQFHREMGHLQRSDVIELQMLNEVQRAKEPHLAIRHGDRLLYFVIWK